MLKLRELSKVPPITWSAKFSIAASSRTLLMIEKIDLSYDGIKVNFLVDPDEVKGDRKKRVAEILAEQGYGVRADIEGAAVLEEGIARNQQKHEYPYRAKNAEPAPVLFQ